MTSTRHEEYKAINTRFDHNEYMINCIMDYLDPLNKAITTPGELRAKLEEITQLTEGLPSILPPKNSRSLNKNFKKLNEIDHLIDAAIKDPSNYVLQNVDLIYSDHLLIQLEAIYPENAYFRYSLARTGFMGRTKQQISRCKSIGQRMSKLGYKTLKTRYYTKIEEGGDGTTTNRTVWVLRNMDRYIGLGEVVLGGLADSQWTDVMTQYRLRQSALADGVDLDALKAKVASIDADLAARKNVPQTPAPETPDFF